MDEHPCMYDCYDINDVTELEDFYEDFKLSKAKAVLLDFLNA